MCAIGYGIYTLTFFDIKEVPYSERLHHIDYTKKEQEKAEAEAKTSLLEYFESSIIGKCEKRKNKLKKRILNIFSRSKYCQITVQNFRLF